MNRFMGREGEAPAEPTPGRVMVENHRINGVPPASGVRPGLIPTEDDLFWVGAMREVLAGATRSSQWAAISVSAASLLGVLTVILVAALRPAESVAARLIWIVPMIFWAVAFFWSVRVFSVRRYRYFANSPDSAREAVMRIARRKSAQLLRALVFWAAGLIAVIVAILAG